MIALAQFGAGRIGQIHTRNVAAADGTCLKYLIDLQRTRACLEVVQ